MNFLLGEKVLIDEGSIKASLTNLLTLSSIPIIGTGTGFCNEKELRKSQPTGLFLGYAARSATKAGNASPSNLPPQSTENTHPILSSNQH